jgi:hypothetical protein
MANPAMRITVDAAMRARDVSRPRGEEKEAAPPPAAEPAKASKNERRRLGKRGPRHTG